MKKVIIDQRGMSLVELSVAVSIMIILMGVISTFIIRSFYVNRFLLEQGLNNYVLQSTLKNFSTNMREAKQSDAGGYMIDQADDFEITFYANVDDDAVTERLHYYFENGQLKLGIAEPAGFPIAYPAEDESVKIIGSGIVNSPTQPIFYYYNRDYPVNAENNPLATPVTPNEISLVKILIQANVNPDQAPDSMRMETFVRPRNFE